MSREIKRVPIDFGHPLRETWPGYLMPEELYREIDCPDCELGYSPRGQELHALWYGNAPFRPEDNGSTPFTVDTPEVRALAERNVTRDEDSLRFYVGNQREPYFIQSAIEREAYRLRDLFNGRWAHHLNQADVDALIAAGRLRDFTHRWGEREDGRRGWQPIEPAPVVTAEQVNRWSLQGFGHDSLNCGIAIRARCEREGVSDTCATCGGHASLERYPGQRDAQEAWQSTEPPTGEGWQLWETVSEGSPVSPVFATAEELAQWLTTAEGGRAAGPSRRPLTISQARAFVAAGWAPTLVGDAGGVHDGVEYVGTQGVLRELSE